MEKTRSLIGKTLLVTLVLVLITVPFMTSAKAFWSAQTIPTTTVYMDPFRIQGNVGDTVIVYLKIKGVTNSNPADENGPLFSEEAGFKFNATAVSCSAVEDGGYITSLGGVPLAFPGTIDNVNGVITPYGWSLTDPSKAPSGDGSLIKLTFHMLVTGFSDLHIYDFIIMTSDGVTEMPATFIDHYTAVVGGSQYIIEIVSNPEGGNAGFADHIIAAINTDFEGVTYKGQLNFTITSPDAAAFISVPPNFGFINVTIPKALMDCAVSSQWALFLNGVDSETRVITTNATHTFLYDEFTYPASPPKAETVSIWSTSFVPEFSSVFFATLLILATFAAALFGKATWSYKRKS